MKRLIPFLSLTLAVLAGAPFLSASEPSATIVPAQRTELFNGRDLIGWTFVAKDPAFEAASIWSVKDGVISCVGKPNGYARTNATFRDYTLHAEWRFPAAPGNSGLFVHVGGPDKIWPVCLEVQLKSGDAGSVRANGGALAHELDLKAKDPKNIALRAPGAEKPIGEWNSCDVVCRGDTITVTINGVLQNEITATSTSAGAIALQAEGAPVEFRNLVVSPLASAAAAKR